MKFTPLLLSLILGLQLAACSKESNTPAASTAAAPAGTPQPAAEPAKPQETAGGLDQKLSTYIECYNALDQRTHASIQRYASWVKNMDAGPTGAEKVVYGLYEVPAEQNIKKCQAEFAGVAGISPSLPLDAVAKEYLEAMDKLRIVVSEAHTYYDRENYKDDQFAKGKEIHPRLKLAMEAFMASSDKISTGIEAENDKRLEAQMRRLEKEDGRKLPFLQMATMHEAKQLIRLISKDSFAAEEAGNHLATYEKITDELLAALKTPQSDAVASSNWGRFADASEDFRKAAKERVRRVRDQVPYSTGEQAILKPGSDWMVEGSPGKTLKAYNELVDRSNSL